MAHMQGFVIQNLRSFSNYKMHKTGNNAPR